MKHNHHDDHFRSAVKQPRLKSPHPTVGTKQPLLEPNPIRLANAFGVTNLFVAELSLQSGLAVRRLGILR